MKSRKYLPIDGDNDPVHGEGGMVCLVLIPDGTAWAIIVLGSVEIVVDTAEHDKKPGDNGQDFVDQHSSRIMAVSLGERIDCEYV
jgi:hypothetical protein